MSVAGKWRVVEMLGYAADYSDPVQSAYILLKNHGAGEFAFGCCTLAYLGSKQCQRVQHLLLNWRR